jgi:hypothetical protein
MAAMSAGMREARVAFLSEIKRVLSASQQAQLKEIVASAAYQPLAANVEWKDLFDGKSLQGWDGDPRYWIVKDGAITGVTTTEDPIDHNTFLIYVGQKPGNAPAEFGDFELKLQYRIVGHNSGIQYRSFLLPGQTDRWRVGGYQADFDAAKATVGANYEEQGRGVLAKRGQATSIDSTDSGGVLKGITSLDDPAALATKVRDAPEWNELHIVAWGNRLTHSINGVQMSKVIDNDQARRRASGHIAIELHAGTPMTVQVRRVRIRSAGSSAVSTLENSSNQDVEVQFDLPEVEAELGEIELKADK